MRDSHTNVWAAWAHGQSAALLVVALAYGMPVPRLVGQSQTPEPTSLGIRFSPNSEKPSDNRFALLVGISDYPGADNDLGGGPLTDVALMKDLLVRKLGFPQENVLELTDLQATGSNIKEAFSAHLARAGRDGVAVFYFSGHGSQVPNANQDSEANVAQDSETDGLDEILILQDSFLRDDTLGRLVASLETNRVLVLLDNCYSGTGTRGAPRSLHWRALAGDLSPPATVTRSQTPVAFPAIAKRISRKSLQPLPHETTIGPLKTGYAPSEPQRHILLSASAENEISLNPPLTMEDGSQMRVGLFTLALYSELHKADLETTSFTTLVSSLQRAMQRATVRLRAGPQTPQGEGTQQGTSVASYLIAQ